MAMRRTVEWRSDACLSVGLAAVTATSDGESGESIRVVEYC